MNCDDSPAASRGWLVAFTAFAVLAVVIAAISPVRLDAGTSTLVATALVAVYAVMFFAVIRRATEGSAAAVASVAATVVVTGGLVAVTPSAALLQFWSYPLIWMLLASTRGAMVWTGALAVAVFVGTAVSVGGDPWWMSALLTAALSYAANVVLGLWITSIYRYGEERERLLGELTAAQGQIAALHRESGVTSERERLSRELHDTLAQSLAGTVLLAQRARRELAAGRLDDAALALVEEAARSALVETRTLVAGTAPVELGGAPLGEALSAIAARFTRETDLPVTVEAAAVDGLDREAEVALLRCAQEALSNVRRHADATAVRLSLVADGAEVRLRVDDDGRGFDAEAAASGFGLSGLRSRVALVGGSVEVDGAAGGTTLVATVPRLAAPDADAAGGPA